MSLFSYLFSTEIKTKIGEKFSDLKSGIKNRKLYKSKFESKRCFLIGTPEHGNLGDQAIAVGEIEFMRKYFCDYKIYEITVNMFNTHILPVKYGINKQDFIILHGGGNLGNEYIIYENMRRKTIKTIKYNKIVIFPQTIYFTNDEIGNKEKQKTSKIYSKNKNLIVVLREKTSYDIAKQLFLHNKILLTPDIALILNKNSSYKRSGVLLCLRNDKECIISEKKGSDILDILNKYDIVKSIDTVLNHGIKVSNRKNELTKICDMFAKSRLVITDRLHGMIFAAITGTPCIAFANYNYKVEGVYEWISYLPFLKFTNNIDCLPQLINEILDEKHYKYNNDLLLESYREIAVELGSGYNDPVN